jgi:hypothetical protein
VRLAAQAAWRVAAKTAKKASAVLFIADPVCFVPERKLLFAGGVIGGFRNGGCGGLGGKRGGGMPISAGRILKRASREPPQWLFRRLNGDEGGIHGGIPIVAKIPLQTGWPTFFAAVPGEDCGLLRAAGLGR